MGLATHYTQEKLIMGLLFHHPDQAQQAKEITQQHWGSCDYESAIFNFSDHSPYYDKEMQGIVFRQFFSFTKLVSPDLLSSIKTTTNEIEKTFQKEHYRPINLDPGLINTGRLVLATTKNATHRIALQDGIYGELTLFYSRKVWNPFPWTYPDFRSESVQEVLSEIRKLYRANIREN
ncbi:DUF4416 family protein [Entomospira entomophila]|uniref:DUF4416 family protein n=1 Tax=Entomospira entomophila TaxID=2719988 RepID=A0A968GAW1_9SPIO|nr:DUF4416 family protein [Entomospira entomophilus]NIZ40268.1 DUF4416 family protein [Entomospira entomophilus]WDI35827.1 DUF4416 family protein [Entomospira entomophilus]